MAHGARILSAVLFSLRPQTEMKLICTFIDCWLSCAQSLSSRGHVITFSRQIGNVRLANHHWRTTAVRRNDFVIY